MRFKTFMEDNIPAFNQWFKGSKVVDAAGKPLVVYHATDKEFDAFNTSQSEMGAHFGTAEQAGSLTTATLKKSNAYYLSIKNPLRLIDRGQWENWDVIDQLSDRGIPTGNLGGNSSIKQIQNLIKKNGYDGIVYINRREGVNNTEPLMSDWEQGVDDVEFTRKFPDAKDSFIAFDPEQIKSVNNKGSWNRTNPNIMEATKTDILSYLEITPSALQPIIDKYAMYGAGYSKKENKTTGMHKVFRKSEGRKLWEDMSDDERKKETLDHVNKDLKIANKEMAGLDAPDKDKVAYYVQRATDFLDPMAPLYKLLLKNMGATITPNGFKLPKHLMQYITEADEPHVKRTYKVTKSMVNSPWVRTAEAFKYRGFAPRRLQYFIVRDDGREFVKDHIQFSAWHKRKKNLGDTVIITDTSYK